MSIIVFGWIAGIHVAMAVWLGILASVWKKRGTWRWIAIGLATSLLGLLLLAKMSRLTRSVVLETDMQMQYLDGTSLLR